jgi:protein TonB
MTGPIMPAARRRFIVMLWLSLALHALVIGLTQLPSPVRVPLPPDLRVEISEPAPVAQATSSAHEPAAKPAPRPPQPLPPVRQEPAQPQAPQTVSPALPIPQVAPAPSTAAPSRESPGPVLDVPLLADARYYTAKELDVQPFALRRPEPAYPVRAEEQGVAGRVLIRLHLEADGSISRTEVVSVAPGGAFGEMFRKATLDSLAGVRFKPARRNGQPVRAVVEIPVVFEPDG